MNLKTQKNTVANLLHVGKKRIWFDPLRLKDIKEAITKTDLRKLIEEKAIRIKPKRGISRFRIRKKIMRMRKGRGKKTGSRKGKASARLPKKIAWIIRVRVQRQFVKLLKDKKLINSKIHTLLRRKIKGGFFRSVRHIKLFIKEHDLIKK